MIKLIARLVLYSGQKIEMELPTLNLPIANNIVVSKAGRAGAGRGELLL